MRYIIFILLLTSCYNQRKATTQHAKAVTAYPKIGADYCASTFPVKDTIIRDTTRTVDTLIVDGLTTTDTVIWMDTVRITTVKTLPSKIITNTVYIRDTIIRQNTAALKACEIDKNVTIGLLKQQTDEAVKYKGQARTRGLWLLGLILFILIITGLNIYVKSKR